MLDALYYTMCADLGERDTLRCSIDVRAEKELKKVIYGCFGGDGGTEYGWFTTVTNIKRNGKQPNLIMLGDEGLKLNKPKATFVYRPKISEPARTMETTSDDIDLFKIKNQFDSLRDQDDLLKENELGKTSGANAMNKDTNLNEDSESDVEEGLNRTPKQSKVQQVVNENRLSICAILESHVDISALSKVCSKVFRSWDWTSNASLCSKGCRIILGWNLDVVNVMVVSQTSQKLDRIMGNTEFIDAFPGAYALFQPYRISDHSPAVLNIPNLPFNKPKPFKFFNFLAHKSQFEELVSSVWNVNVDGHKMYQVVSKLIALKKPFRKLLHDQGNLHDRVNKLRFELDDVQKALDLNPNDLSLREEEVVYVQAFSEAKLDEERFLKQKAKIEWLEVGDSNSAYFHKLVKSRIHRGRIDVIMNSDNIEVTGSNVADVFVSHYQMFLGSDMVCDNLNMDGLFLKKVSADSFSNMVRPVTDEEIKAVMFSIGDERAPGPDGFSSAFFKKGWDIVGLDVCHAIRDYFVNGRLLKEINHTFIALIPKMGLKSGSWALVTLPLPFLFDLNGDIHGFFKGKRGLRQGDPLVLKLVDNRFQPVSYGVLKEFKLTSGWSDLIRGFLWCNGEYKRGKAKVAWDDIYLPKCKGGLGLRSLDLFNMALMTTHIWNIVSNKESLWVRWIHTYKLRNRSFWDLPIKDNVSWGWLKLLQLRVLVRSFFWVKLGNGRDTSVWHDSWCPHCPLSHFISPQDIYSDGFNNQAMVADFVLNNAWTWPQAWIAKAPILNLIPAPNLDENTVDCIRWRDINGVFSEFSVSRAWEAFRPRGNEVNYLKTQDKLRQWDVGINTDLNLLRCSLCNTQSDSHAHLFFECPYSSKVWKLVRHLADMELVPPILYDIVDHLQPMANKKRLKHYCKPYLAPPLIL
ncbi:reverse transcriptase domain-containing protein [Tanacetum coccineum]